jgi:hypothetical protein
MVSELNTQSGWSNSGTLLTRQGGGKGTEIIANPTGPQVSLQVDFKAPSAFTVAFNLTPIDNPQQFINNQPNVTIMYMAEALIEMTVAGNTTTRRVSVGNGVTVQGIAESVRVIAWDTTPNPGVYGNLTSANPLRVAQANLRYQVSVNVARGYRAVAPAPPILIPPPSYTFFPQNDIHTNLNPGSYFPEASSNPAFLLIPIPFDAGVLAALLTMNSDAAPFNNTASGMQYVQGEWATFISRSPLNWNFNTLWSVQQYQSVWNPMPPGVDALVIQMITNPGATGLIVGVALGIDG